MSLNQYGIGTAGITRDTGRMGIYFIELGSSIRPSRVVYDRANSCISNIQPGEFNWPEILKGVDWIHLSGITLALSENCLAESIKAVETARQMKVGVSFDMNFRRSLWSDKTQARAAYQAIMQHTDLLFGNEGSLNDIFDWESTSDTDKKDQDLIQKVIDTFNIPKVAFTRRDHLSASTNGLATTLFMNGSFYQGKPCQVEVSDRFGTGDSFAAGVLHGLAVQWEPKKIIDFASAAFAYKHTLKGDQLLATEDEIVSVMKGNIHGHVLR